LAVYRQLTITFQENGDVDYQFFRSSADGNLARYLIAYPAEKVSVCGGENLASDNFRSAITREGHVLLTWERGPGGKRGIHYSKIGFLEAIQQDPLLLHYRERIHIKNERQPVPLARPRYRGTLTQDAYAAPRSRDAVPLAPWATPPGLTRDADASAPPLSRDAYVAGLLEDQPNVFLLKVHDRNQHLSAVESRSQAVFHCTSRGMIHTCQAFLRHSHGTTRLECSEHPVEAGQRIHLRPTELVGAQFICAGVLSIDWILGIEEGS
jgi:hypothetical protein